MPLKIGTTFLDIGAKLSPSFGRDLERQASPALDSVGRKLQTTGAAITKTLTPAAAGAALVLKRSFEEVDTGLDTIRAGTGATGSALDDLGASMKAVAGRVTQPISEVGQVIADLHTRTGATGEGLETLATKLLGLSRVTKTDATANTAAITRVFGDWSIATEDQSLALDQLLKVSQSTGIGVTHLADEVVRVGAPMRGLGFSFAETAALIGKFEKEGVNAELVLGGLRQGLARVAKAGGDPRAEFDKLAASIDQTGLTAENTEAVFKLFGARAGQDLGKALEEGRFKLGDFAATLEGAGGTLDSASADTLDLSDKFDMLKNRVVGAIGPFGEFGSIVAGGLATVGPMIFGLGSLTTALKGSAVASRIAGLAMNSIPIIAIGAAVATLAFLFVTHFDTIKRVAGDVFGGLGDVAKGGVNAVVIALNGLIRFWEIVLNTIVKGYNLIRKVHPISRVPGVGRLLLPELGELELPRIPRLARGGVLDPGQLGLVGEQGVELLRAGREPMRVIPPDALATPRGLGERPIEVKVLLDGRQLADVVLERGRQKQRRDGLGIV